MSHEDNNTVPKSFQDKFILAMVRFFRAEWSGAFLAIVVLGISIELATSGRPFFHPTNLMTILNNSAAIGVVKRNRDLFSANTQPAFQTKTNKSMIRMLRYISPLRVETVLFSIKNFWKSWL